MMSPQEQIADEKIREALARGEDKNLPGKGRPVDLDAYFAAPEEWRMAFSVLRSANVLPEELELLKEIERLKAGEAAAGDDAEERRRLRKRIAELSAILEIKLQRFTKPG
jgi:hypothetical protein